MSRRRRIALRIGLRVAVAAAMIWFGGVRLLAFPGESMEPTVRPGDFLVELVGPWHWRSPKRFDMLIFDVPPSSEMARLNVPWMKRLVGLPGERVRLAGAELFIDDKKVDAPFLHADGAESQLDPIEVTLGDDEYFLLGDSLQHSVDSRSMGPVKRSLVRGFVIGVFHRW